MADTDRNQTQDPHPGMMGDGTEEQNLGQTGHPENRIKKEEVEAAFGQDGEAGGDQGQGSSGA